MHESDNAESVAEQLLSFVKGADEKLYPALLALKKLPHNDARVPELEHILQEASARMQLISDAVSPFCSKSVAEKPQAEPVTEPKKTERQATLNGQPTTIPSTPLGTAKKPKRRLPSKAYDFLLLEAFRHQDSLDYPIGLDVLFNLALAFDENTKRGSLTAKLNRFRNDESKQFITWKESADMEITTAGEVYRDEIRGQVIGMRELDRVNDIIQIGFKLDR